MNLLATATTHGDAFFIAAAIAAVMSAIDKSIVISLLCVAVALIAIGFIGGLS